MEIFDTFGLDPIVAIAQVVNFLIILYILKRFLYKPLFSVLKKREDLVKDSIKKSDDSTKALEKAQVEEETIIRKAQERAGQIIDDAEERADDIIKKAKEATKQQTDKMISDAKIQIDQESNDAKKQLDEYVTTLSVELLKKSIKNVFTEDEQSKIIQKATKEIQKQSQENV